MSRLSFESNNPYSLQLNTANRRQASSYQPQQDAPKATPVATPSVAAVSVYLHRLDGTPYPIPVQNQQIRVAKDMYDGQDPPGYRSKASHGNLRQATRPITDEVTGSCQTCGRTKAMTHTDSQSVVTHTQCNRCGKRRAASTRQSQELHPVQQPRSVSDDSARTLVNPTSPWTSPEATPTMLKKKCHKCGKMKRPPTSAGENTPTSSDTILSSVPPAAHIARQHVMYSGVRLSSTPPPSGPIRRKPVPICKLEIPPPTANIIDIDVIPPTAVSSRPHTFLQNSPNTDGSPLLPLHMGQSRPTPRRSTSISSIASSIGRSLSKRRRRSDGSVEGSQTAQQNNDSGASRLINMITNAMSGNQSQNYSKLDKHGDRHARSPSPFSFIDKPVEDSIELDQLARSSPDHERYSWEQIDVSGSHISGLKDNPFADSKAFKRPGHSRSGSGGSANPPSIPEEPENDVCLAAPGQSTELTRFKSLRTGVQRAGSVARSTSLKRLNSLKNAPQYWYREDMAIEGATVGVY